MKVTHYLCQTP